MIRRQFYIDRLDWKVCIYYAVDKYDTYSILQKMKRIGASDKFLYIAKDNMLSNNMDTGVTYSNFLHRATVMVIGIASSAHEFFNSYTHEMRHLQDDLANMNGIPLDGEDVAYLSGEIAMKVFDYIKKFICYEKKGYRKSIKE